MATENQILDAAFAVYAVGQDNPTPDIAPPAGFQRLTGNQFTVVNELTGLVATTYRNPTTNEHIISFRGTASPSGAVADANRGWPQYQQSLAAVRSLLASVLAASPSQKVVLTGHSLGGALAQFAAYDFARTNANAGSRIEMVTWNSLGGRWALEEHVGDLATGATFDANLLDNRGVLSTHYFRFDDLVSRLGNGHVGGQTVMLGRDEVNTFADILTAHMEEGLREGLLRFRPSEVSPVYINLNDDAQKVSGGIGAGLLNFAREQLGALPPNATDNDKLNSMVLGSLLTFNAVQPMIGPLGGRPDVLNRTIQGAGEVVGAALEHLVKFGIDKGLGGQNTLISDVFTSVQQLRNFYGSFNQYLEQAHGIARDPRVDLFRNIPIVGAVVDQARSGVSALVDLRNQFEAFIADIESRFPAPASFAYKSTDLMADLGELLARAGAKINKLAVNTTANTEFELDLDVQWGAKHTTKLDGLLDLGDLLKVKSDGNLDLGVDAQLKVKLGQDSAGFFVNTGLANPAAGGGYKNELSIGVDVDLNESTLKAKLGGFLDFDVKDSTKDKEEASARANFDLTTTNADGKWRPSNGAIPVNSSLDSKVALDLGLTLSAFGNDPNLNFLPKLLADLKVDWGFQASSTQTKPTELECPTIKLDNIRLDLRELLGPQGFVSKVIGPVKDVASVVASVTGPLADPIQPLQNKSLADLLVSAGKINQATADSIKNVDQVADAVQSLAGRIDAIAEDGGEYKLGSIVLMEGGPGSSGKCSLSQAKLKERGTKPRGSSDQSPGREPKPQGWNPPQLQGQEGKEIEVNAALNTQITGGGIEFPLLSDPWSAIGLLFGADVDLFRFKLPTLSVQGNLDIPPFPIPNPFVPGLSAKVGGDLGVFAQLGGGYDTVGIRSMLESGNPLANLDDLFEGLYLSDLPGNELEFKGSLSVAGGIEAGFASAYLGGGLRAAVGVDLNDPDNDGKLRVAGMLKQPNFDFGSLFNFSGKLSAFAFVEGSLGTFKQRLDLGEVTLLEYQNEFNDPERVDPGGVTSSGNLLLHMGRNASLSGADSVGLGPDETARLVGIPNGLVSVTYGSLGTAKTKRVTGSISGFGDGGDDSLTVAGALSRPLTFDAGPGNDRVLSGGGDDSLLGGDGRDILHGRGGRDTILGGAGDDVLVPAGSDTNDTDDGQVDSLDGGAGVDRLSYEFLRGALRIDLSSGAPAISGAANDIARNIEEFGGGLGADTMIGGTLGDRFDGGGGNDTLSGGMGNDVLAGGDGFDTLNGGDGADALFGGANPDTLLGGVGDDALAGGLGADRLDGGDGTDTAVYAASGSSVGVRIGSWALGNSSTGESFGDVLINIENITGSAHDDVLEGSRSANLIDGGPGRDTLGGGFGDDVYVVDDAGDVVDDAIELFDPVAPGDFTPPPLFDPLNPRPVPRPPGRTPVFEHGGIDTVLSSVTFTLAANLEHLVLTEPVAQPLTAPAASAGIGFSLADRVKNWNPSASSDWFTRAEGIKLLFTAPPAAIDGTGNASTNRIVGNAGANVLRGLAGSDTLEGGGGDDTLDGGEGADALRGGDGFNTVSYAASPAAVNINLTTGAVSGGHAQGDTLTAVQNVIGSSGADSLVGSSAGNLLDGGGGNDTLVGGAGNDTYVLDSVSDRITETGSDTGDAVHAPFALDLETLAGGVIEHARLTGDKDVAIRGNATNNSLTGDNGRNTLTGLAGNDFLDGGKSDDTMFGGAGDDTYVVDSAGDIVAENAKEGTDTVRSSLKDFKLDPNFEHLELAGTAEINGAGNEQGNRLTGNSAANLLDGGAGADTMAGGAGNDTYVVDNTGDVVTEGANEGVDIVLSSIANALLGANFEHLRLTGNAAIGGTGNTLNNSLAGNSAANLLDGGAGVDTMTGGEGNDTYVFENKDDIAVEISDGGIDEVRTAIDLGGLALDANAENLVLTGTAAIRGTGNALDNRLTGNSAANLLDGGAGADTMVGGAGNDTYRADDTDDVVTEAASAGNDEIVSTVDYTLPAFVENLLLRGSGPTKGTGNALGNIIDGDFGDNLIDGGTGADTFIGSEGNDTFIVDNAGDVVFDGVFEPEGAGLANQGIDTVRSSVSFVLGDAATLFRGSAAGFLEHLELTGTTAINGTGNRLDNKLTGNTGNNSLAGLGGSDSLDGGAGADTMTGGAGNDTYVVDNAGDRATEIFNEGTDTVRSSVAHILGLHFEHLVLTGAAAINGTGNASSNSLTGNSAANTLTGGLGNDTYTVGAGDAVVEQADQGTDIVSSSATHTLSANVEHLVLTGGLRLGAFFSTPDRAINGTGNALPNSLTGNSAGNLLDGRGGVDTMAGGLGNDTYVMDNAADRVTENSKAGTDTVRSSVTFALGDNLEHLELTGIFSIAGTGNALDNRITGNLGGNLLAGGDGNDTIRGAQGADTLTGGAGFDLLDGENGADSMAGGAGNDTYVVDDAGDILTENANEGTDTLRSLRTFTLGGNFEHLVLAGTTAINGTGNTSNNSLTGNGAANILTGLAGNDYLDGGAGNDLLDGGLGDDTYVVDTAGDVVVEAPAAGTDTVRSSVALTLGTHSEHLVLTGTAAITGTGNSLDNRLIGNVGNNSLDGRAGNDTLNGGAGDDVLDGGLGADFFVGGLGNDTFFVDDAGDSIAEEANAGTDTVISTVSREMRPNLENLVLVGVSRIDGLGNDQANVISGHGGNNSIDGRGGNDTLSGCVVGANGGRREIDTLTGGTGNDLFVLGWSAGRLYDDTLPVFDGRGDYALITDFTVGQDKLQLDGAAKDYFLEAGRGVSGVAGSGLFHDTNANAKWDATDELIAVVRSANSAQLTTANTIGAASFV